MKKSLCLLIGIILICAINGNLLAADRACKCAKFEKEPLGPKAPTFSIAGFDFFATTPQLRIVDNKTLSPTTMRYLGLFGTGDLFIKVPRGSQEAGVALANLGGNPIQVEFFCVGGGKWIAPPIQKRHVLQTRELKRKDVYLVKISVQSAECIIFGICVGNNNCLIPK